MGWRRTVQILGGVCIGIGVLSLCSNLNELLIGVIGPDESMKDAQGVPAMMQDSMEAQYRALEKPAYRGYLAVAGGLDSLAAVLAVVAGIGLLMVRPWGRRLAMGWAGYALISAAAGVVMACRYLFPEIASTSSQPIPDGAVYFFGILMLLVLWAFPAVLLTLLTLAGAKRAFDRPPPAPRPAPMPIHLARSMPGPTPPAQHAAPQPPAATGPPASPDPAPPTPAPAQQTWRDDPWNDPDAT
jgi:hypothetical protein